MCKTDLNLETISTQIVLSTSLKTSKHPIVTLKKIVTTNPTRLRKKLRDVPKPAQRQNDRCGPT